METKLVAPYTITVFAGGGGGTRQQADFVLELGRLASERDVRFKMRLSGGNAVADALAASGADCFLLTRREEYDRLRYAENRPPNVTLYPRHDEEDFGLALAQSRAAIIFPGGEDELRATMRYILGLNGDAPRRLVMFGSEATGEPAIVRDEIHSVLPDTAVVLTDGPQRAFFHLFVPSENSED